MQQASARSVSYPESEHCRARAADSTTAQESLSDRTDKKKQRGSNERTRSTGPLSCDLQKHELCFISM